MPIVINAYVNNSIHFIAFPLQGVFVKTLLNMWAICAFINPALSLLCVFVIDPKVMAANPNDGASVVPPPTTTAYLHSLLVAH